MDARDKRRHDDGTLHSFPENATPFAIRFCTSTTTNTMKAGINYKFYGPSGFFGPSAVVVAKD